jgi:hypothetical protein
MLAWSAREQELLDASAGCTAHTCYVHITLDAPGWQQQEATVWLAPYSALELADPRLVARHFGADPHGGVRFEVAAERVAVHALWELRHGGAADCIPEAASAGVGSDSSGSDSSSGGNGSGGNGSGGNGSGGSHSESGSRSGSSDRLGLPIPAGRFSDNDLTVHPCEPRAVRFLPATVAAASTSSSSESGSSDYGSSSSSNTELSERLSVHLALSSLYHHQRWSERLLDLY